MKRSSYKTSTEIGDRKVTSNIDHISINKEALAKVLFRLFLRSCGVDYYEEVRYPSTS